MARTVEAILTATTSGFNAAVDASAVKLQSLGQKAVAAGAKIDSSLTKAGSGAAKLGASTKAGTAAVEQGMTRAAKASDRFSKSTSGIQKSEQHLNTLGRTAGIAGVAIGAGLLLAGKQAADFDQAMSHVAATGTEFKTNLDGLRKAAIDAGAATAFSATEAANAEEELSKAGVSAKDVLGGGLKGALDLAAAGTLGVADAANIAATAMSQFKLKGTDVPHIADLLAAGAGKAQGSVQDLGNALGYVGPVAQGMGVSIEQTVGVLAEFANAGIVGEQGGTALRGVLLSLTSPSAAAAKAMKQYGIELYDAQGNFVGVNGAAQALKDGLGGLDNATRDAALGQIFGNAQVTAARVLYNGGAAEVDKWTAAVTDSGFAARAAATKMDNLKGDVEKLGGSLQTAFIQSGEGAQGGLRGITQAAAGAVDAFNGLGSSTKGTAVAVLAIGAAGLLSVAGVAKLAVGISSSRTAMAGLKADAPRLSGALTGIGKAAGVAAAALIALQIAGAVQKQFKGNFTPAVEEANKALTDLATIPDANIDSKFKFSSGIVIKDQVDSLGSAFQRLGQNRWSDSLAEGVDKLTGTTDAVTTKIKLQFTALDQSISGLSANGHADQAAAAFKKIADAAALQGVPVEQLVSLFPQYAQSVRGAADASKYTIGSTQELANIMGGKLPAGLVAANAAAAGLNGSLASTAASADAFTAALTTISGPLSFTGQAADKLSQSIFAEGNAFQNGASAHSTYAASLDAAGISTKKHATDLSAHSLAIDKDTGFLKDNTDKQRAAGTAIGELASSGKAYVQSLVSQGASAKEAASATATVRAEFVKAADAAGLSAGEANKLADSYGLIPKQVSTEFQTFGLALQAQQVKDYGDRILALPKEQQAKIIAIYNSKGADAALAELNKLDGKTARPKVAVESDAQKVAQASEGYLRGIKGAKPKIQTESDAKRVAASANGYIRAIKDKHPKVVTEKDMKAAQSAVSYLKAIRDKHPKVVSEKDIRAAQAAVRYLQGIRDVHPNVGVTVSGLGGIQSRINQIHGKTVVITQKTVKSGNRTASANADGGMVTTAGTLFRSSGGPVWGAGTATSDSIDAKLSDGEYVQRTAAVDKYGVGFMQALNNLRFDPKSLPAYRGGGSVRSNHLATGGQPQSMWYGEKAYGTVLRDILGIDRKIAALSNPLAAVAVASRAVVAAQTAYTAEAKKIAGPKNTLTSSTNRLAAAQKQKATDQADQLALRKHVDVLKKRADATKGTTQADKDYQRAQDQLTRVTRTISGETLKITGLTKAHTAAQTAYNAVAEKSKAAADRLTEAQAALATQQQAVADAARAIADTLVASANSTSTDPLDVLAKRKETAASLAAFNSQLLALRKGGLNDQDIADIVSRGALDGAELASAVLKGGKGLIGALNTAEANLQHAADAVGITTSVGVIRRASGGWVDGQSGVDKIPALLTRREFVVNDKSAMANAGLIQAVNASGNRSLVADLVRGAQTYGGHSMGSVSNSDSHNISIPINVERLGESDHQRALNDLRFGLQSALVGAGLV